MKQTRILDSWATTGAKALKDNFRRYKKFVDELDFSSSALPPPLQIQDAFYFFVSHKASLFASKNNMPQVPGERTKRLVEFLDYQYQNNPQAEGEWIYHCVRMPNNSRYEALTQAVDFFLRPLSGTASSIRMSRLSGSGMHRNREHQEEMVLEALQNASRVVSLIFRLGEQPMSDLAVSMAILRLWKTRCWCLGNSNFGAIQLSPEVHERIFGGARGTEDCVTAMSEIIENMENNHASDAAHQELAYATLVSSLAFTGVIGSANRARKIFSKFEEKQQVQQGFVHSAAMLAFANEATINREEAVKGARELWEYVCSQKHLKPTAAEFNTLLVAHSNARMPEECERQLLQQERSALGGHRPTNIDYNVAINSWAKTRTPGSAKKALALYYSMVNLAPERPDVAPDVFTYTSVIDALARNPDTGQEGLDLAEHLLQHCESGEDSNVKPDPTLYKKYMQALSVRLFRQGKVWAKKKIAERIESLLFRMKDRSFEYPESASDWHNASIYSTAIDAWTKTRDVVAPKRALDLYFLLKEEGRRAEGKASLKPDMKLFEDLLRCMAAQKPHRNPDVKLAQHIVLVAQGLLSDIQREGYPLTAKTLNLYLRVLSTRGIREAVEEAENTLQKLEHAYSIDDANVVPDSYSYQVVMEGCAMLPGSADPERAEKVLDRMIALSNKYEERKATLYPQPACYAIAMNAWVKSRREDSADNVERIMKEVEKQGIQPTEHMYTTLMNSFAGSIDGPEKAEAIITQMQSDYESGKNPLCKPTSVAFAAYLKCLGMSVREDTPDKMDAVLMHLQALKEHKEYRELSINYSSFKNTLFAWQTSAPGRPDAGDRAYKLIKMVDEHARAGKLEEEHVMHCYNIAMVTMARCPDGEKAAKAYNLLRRLREGGYRLRERDFHAVLLACKEVGTVKGVRDLQKKEAFRIANATFLECMGSGCRPDEALYKEMIDLHGTLLDAGEDAQATRDQHLRGMMSDAPMAIQQSELIQSSVRSILSLD